MAMQTINIGTLANDGTGDSLRVAMGKANSNFTELAARYGVTSAYAGGVLPSNSAAANASALQTLLDAGGLIVFPYSADVINIDNSTPLSMTSNTVLVGNYAAVKRTDDDKPLVEAIGTAGAHLEHVGVFNFHFMADNAVDTGLPNTGNDAHGVFRAAYCDKFRFCDNICDNITAGTYVADGYADNPDWTDGFDGWMAVDADDLPRGIRISNNIGRDTSSYSGITGNTHFVVMAFCRDFKVEDNIIDGYHSGIVCVGGKANNPAGATYLPTSGFSLADDDDFKCFDGVIRGNVIDVSNVGVWCWTARDLKFRGNHLRGCANENFDAEASVRITFEGNSSVGSTGAVFNVFYDCDDIRFIGNDISIADGGEMLLMAAQDTSAATCDFGRLVIEDNKVRFATAQGALVSSEIFAAAEVSIRRNLIEYTNLKIYGGHKNVFIEDNDLIESKVTFSNAMIRASVGAADGNITFEDNVCTGGLATTILDLSYTADDTFVSIKRNKLLNCNYGWNIGTAAVGSINGSGVLMTIACEDNIIGNTQPQPALVQDNSAVLDDTELKVIWRNNSKPNGDDCYASNPSAISSVNMRWSKGSTIRLAATAGSYIGMVCTTSGWQTNATWKNYGAIAA